MALSERLALATVTADGADHVGQDASLSAHHLLRSVFPRLFMGALVDSFMLWASMTEVVGSGLRPSSRSNRS